jgi:hypothetical protein
MDKEKETFMPWSKLRQAKKKPNTRREFQKKFTATTGSTNKILLENLRKPKGMKNIPDFKKMVTPKATSESDREEENVKKKKPNNTSKGAPIIEEIEDIPVKRKNEEVVNDKEPIQNQAMQVFGNALDNMFMCHFFLT